MEMRKLQFYPPYAFLVGITIKGKNEKKVIESTYQIVDYLNEHLQENGLVLGPATPYVPYERGLFLRSIQIKYTNRELMQSVLQNIPLQLDMWSQSISFNSIICIIVNTRYIFMITITIYGLDQFVVGHTEMTPNWLKLYEVKNETSFLSRRNMVFHLG